MPVRVADAVESLASLENESVAEVDPEIVGVNATENDALCPTLRVIGREIPESTNSLLELPAPEIVTGFCVAFTEPVSEVVFPTVTFPKPMVPGETVNCPCAVSAPERAMVSAASCAVDVTESVPFAEPPPTGANVTVKVTLSFCVSVIGMDGAFSENPEPLTLAADMVTAVAPVFVSVSVRWALLFFATLPKLSA